MKRINTKTNTGRTNGRTADAIIRNASISARDQLAYAAALKILG
jgi:hypothetical protein